MSEANDARADDQLHPDPTEGRGRVHAVSARYVGIAAALCALLTLALRWPGALTVDSTNQLQQAISGRYTDWHPPLMAFLWSWLGSSREAMLILQVGMFWVGLAMVAQSVRSRWPLLVGLSPIAVFYLGVIGKDTLLMSALMLGFGLMAIGWRWAGAVVIVVGGFLRANAGFAIGPLLLKGRKRWWSPIIGVAMVGAVGLTSALTAERTGVERGLQLFDLAGIDHFRNAGRFPHRCYTPMLWDTLSTDRCGNAFQRERGLTAEWLASIARHPVAYAQHRAAHFNHSTFFIVPPAQQCVEAPEMHECPVSIRSDFLAKNALFWPCVWLAVGIALLFMPGLGATASGLALSGLIYGFSYALVGVASDFRYFLWTEIAVQLALVLAWLRGVPLRRPLIAGAAVAAIGYAARAAFMLWGS